MKKLLSKRVINQTTRKKQSVKMASVILTLLFSMLTATSVHAQDESGAVHAEDWKGVDISDLTGDFFFEAPISKTAKDNFNKGVSVKGIGFTLTKVELIKSNGTSIPLTMKQNGTITSFQFTNWGQKVDIDFGNSNPQVGDRIRCTYTGKTNDFNCVFAYSDDWSDIEPLNQYLFKDGIAFSDEVYLYNVKTGKFMYIGGDWGVKPELQYRDFGLKFKMCKIGIHNPDSNTDEVRYEFTSDVFTKGTGDTNGNYLGLMQGYEGDEGKLSNGITVDKKLATLDGVKNNVVMYCYSRFQVQRKSGENGGTYTYVLSLSPKEYNAAIYELKKGNIGDWDNIPNNTYYLKAVDNGEGGLKVVETNELDETGYWRFVPISVIDAAVRDMAQNSVDAFNGMNLDVTYEIDNQGFNRNNEKHWSTGNGADYLKYVPNNSNYSAYPLDKPAYNGKYYYGLLMKSPNTNGTVYRTFTAPAAGWYKVQCQGVSNSDNKAVVYAKANGNTAVTVPLNVDGNLLPYSEITKTGEDYKENMEKRVNLGKAFYNNQYPVEVYVYANAGEPIELGIMQTAAYNPDSDLTAFDNFQIKFLGDIFVLDEDYTECTNENGYTTGTGENGATVILHRTFSKKEDGSYYWNTLTLPISLTGVQVKEAFGDNVKLAIATGLGQNDPYLITFRTEDAAKGIQAGQFYLIKPAKEPDTPVGQEKVINGKTYTGPLYTLGRRDVPEISDAVFGDGHSFWDPLDPNEHNSILYQGTYLKRENFVPANSYVFSKGDMYHTKTPQTIKGFRFWIEDRWNKSGSAKPFTLSIGGVEDQQEAGQIITTISEVETVTDDNAAVYSLSGQFLGKGKQLLNSLPKGVYVVNNKKYMVK